MKKLMLSMTTLAVMGCAAPAIGTPVETGNAELAVVRIGKVEDCTIYRFVDAGYYNWLTICPRANTTTTHTHTQPNGKTTTSWPVSLPVVVR